MTDGNATWKLSWKDRIKRWFHGRAITHRCVMCEKRMWPWRGYYHPSWDSGFIHHECRPALDEAEALVRRERFELSLREELAQ